MRYIGSGGRYGINSLSDEVVKEANCEGSMMEGRIRCRRSLDWSITNNIVEPRGSEGIY